MEASADLDVLGDAGLVSEADVLAEFQEAGMPRRRSSRRRRSTGSSRSNAASGFALDTPKTS
jgi:hypothetical protein